MNQTEHNISSIGDVQIALMENDNSAIKRYIERLDRETSNEAMKQAGTHFDFKTTEIEGVVRVFSGHLSEVFGYKEQSALKRLLKRWGIDGIKMAGFGHDNQSLIRNDLNLSDKDYSAVLYDWPAFLIGGMNSTNEPARQVQLYLLKMEKMARVGVVSSRFTQQTSKQLPEPAHAIVMEKLSKDAYRGNPIAAYVLEMVYGIPVSKLLGNVEPEFSEVSAVIDRFLHIAVKEYRNISGVKSNKPSEKPYIQATHEMFYRIFIEIARKHNLTMFATSVPQLASLMSREADALQLLGWRRNLQTKVHGSRFYRYEYVGLTDENIVEEEKYLLP